MKVINYGTALINVDALVLLFYVSNLMYAL